MSLFSNNTIFIIKVLEQSLITVETKLEEPTTCYMSYSLDSFFNVKQSVKIKVLPFADIAPPVTHPATTVFVVSCLARA